MIDSSSSHKDAASSAVQSTSVDNDQSSGSYTNNSRTDAILRSIFSMVDLDGGNSISAYELHWMIKVLKGDSLQEAEVVQMISDPYARLTFEDFSRILTSLNWGCSLEEVHQRIGKGFEARHRLVSRNMTPDLRVGITAESHANVEADPMHAVSLTYSEASMIRLNHLLEREHAERQQLTKEEIFDRSSLSQQSATGLHVHALQTKLELELRRERIKSRLNAVRESSVKAASTPNAQQLIQEHNERRLVQESELEREAEYHTKMHVLLKKNELNQEQSNLIMKMKSVMLGKVQSLLEDEIDSVVTAAQRRALVIEGQLDALERCILEVGRQVFQISIMDTSVAHADMMRTFAAHTSVMAPAIDNGSSLELASCEKVDCDFRWLIQPAQAADTPTGADYGSCEKEEYLLCISDPTCYLPLTDEERTSSFDSCMHELDSSLQLLYNYLAQDPERGLTLSEYRTFVELVHVKLIGPLEAVWLHAFEPDFEYCTELGLDMHTHLTHVFEPPSNANMMASMTFPYFCGALLIHACERYVRCPGANPAWKLRVYIHQYIRPRMPRLESQFLQLTAGVLRPLYERSNTTEQDACGTSSQLWLDFSQRYDSAPTHAIRRRATSNEYPTRSVSLKISTSGSLHPALVSSVSRMIEPSTVDQRSSCTVHRTLYDFYEVLVPHMKSLSKLFLRTIQLGQSTRLLTSTASANIPFGPHKPHSSDKDAPTSVEIRSALSSLSLAHALGLPSFPRDYEAETKHSAPPSLMNGQDSRYGSPSNRDYSSKYKSPNRTARELFSGEEGSMKSHVVGKRTSSKKGPPSSPSRGRGVLTNPTDDTSLLGDVAPTIADIPVTHHVKLRQLLTLLSPRVLQTECTLAAFVEMCRYRNPGMDRTWLAQRSLDIVAHVVRDTFYPSMELAHVFDSLFPNASMSNPASGKPRNIFFSYHWDASCKKQDHPTLMTPLPFLLVLMILLHIGPLYGTPQFGSSTVCPSTIGMDTQLHSKCTKGAKKTDATAVSSLSEFLRVLVSEPTSFQVWGV